MRIVCREYYYMQHSVQFEVVFFSIHLTNLSLVIKNMFIKGINLYCLNSNLYNFGVDKRHSQARATGQDKLTTRGLW